MESIPADPSTSGKQPIVMLVEDHESVRRITSRILRKAGCQTLVAGNGEEALRVVKEYGKPIDLLLTDVMMPRMNGCQLAERLLDLQPGLKILYCSGFEADALMRKEKSESNWAFLPKPFSPEVLIAALRELLAKG